MGRMGKMGRELKSKIQNLKSKIQNPWKRRGWGDGQDGEDG